MPAIATCIALVVFAALYLKETQVSIPAGGTPLSRFYGWTGLGLTLFLTCYSLRKRWQILWPGSLEAWLRWHVFLSVLALAVVLFHSGFRFGGTFEAGTLILLTAITINGFLGIVMFMLIPPMLSAFDTRSRVEDLPEEVAGAITQMHRLSETYSGPLREAVERDLLDRLECPRTSWRKARLPTSEDLLQSVGLSVADEKTEVLDQLHELAASVMEKQRHITLNRRVKLIEAAGLHVHVALTTALLFLVAAHLFSVWYY